MIWRLTIACTLATVLTIAPAIVEGIYNNRWGTVPDMSAAAEQLKQFPKQFGHWTLAQEGEPVSDTVSAELSLAGYVSRDYVNRENGAHASLLLMVGESGPLLRHPPNICYANRANEQVGEITKLQVKSTNPTSDFNLLVYKRPHALTNDRFLVAYSMPVGPEWSAPYTWRVKFWRCAAPL